MNIYFSGIGGIGISSLAQFCLNRGDVISGSDISESVMTKNLRNKGVEIFLKQESENITKGIDIFIYSEAVPESNPERKKAKKLNIKSYSYFEYLGIISRDFKTIAVAGTHGKTTTTGLAASGFLSTSVNPSVIIGTILDLFGGTNFHAGKDKILLVEACEYRENFKFLSPEIVILTGIDHDHIDAFPTKKSYFRAFEKLIKKSKIVIYHEGDENVESVLQKFNGQKIAVKNTRNFDLNIIGDFNQRNASLAFALTDVLDIDKSDFEKGLQKFQNISRRQEFLGEKNGVLFYDDYAHHPAEIKELYKGFKEKFRGKKVGIVFEPHQHSRTKELFVDFCKVFAEIDKLGIMPIYAARDSEEDKKFTTDAFFRQNSKWIDISNKKDMKDFLEGFDKEDVIIFCGAGDVSKFGREFLKS